MKWKLGQNDEIYDLKKDSLLILGAGLTHKGLASCAAGTKTMYFHVSRNDGDLIYADVDFDGIVSAADAREILRASVGLTDKKDFFNRIK